MEADRWADLGHGELSVARVGSRSEARLLETDPGVTSEITQGTSALQWAERSTPPRHPS